MTGGRFIIGRGRTDIDILSGTTFEKRNITLHLSRQETNELTDSIELFITEQSQDFVRLINIDNNLFYTDRNLVPTMTTIQQPQVVAACC